MNVNLENILHRHLDPIIDRRGIIHKRRERTIVFTITAILAWIAWYAAREGAFQPLMWLLLPLLGGVFTAIFSRFAFNPKPIDLREVAREIEADNPELKALLLTAVEQKSEGELSYLQEQVIDEALRESIAAQWRNNVALKENRGWGFAMRLAAIAMMVASVALVGTVFERTFTVDPAMNFTENDTEVTEIQTDEWSLEVDPGDVEIERGSRLLVTARFDGLLPGEVDLEMVIGDTGMTIPMHQNLTDPVFSASVQEIAADGVYRLTAGGEKSRDFTVTTFELPKVEDIDVEIKAPSATDLETKKIEDTRRVTVLEGSTLKITVCTNKPMASGSLIGEFGGDERNLKLEVDRDDPSKLNIELMPQEDTKLRVHLSDADGRKNRRPPTFNIKVKKNLPPKIDLAFPQMDAEVTPIQELTAEAKIWDDVKIVAAGATYQFGDETRDISFDTAEFRADHKEVVATILDFEALEAQPNDLLTYYFWAEDTDSKGEPRRVSSDLRFAEVRHFEEIFREQPSQGDSQSQQQEQQEQGEGQQGNQADDLIEKQKEILNATWKLKRLIVDKPAQLPEDASVIHAGQLDVINMTNAAAEMVGDAEAASHLARATEEMQAAADKLAAIESEDDVELLDAAQQKEQAAYAALLRMRAREFQVTQAKQQQSSSSSSSSSRQQRQQQKLSNMDLKEEKKGYETQRLANRQQTEQRQAETREDVQMLNRLKELAQRQSGITDKIQELQAMLEEKQTAEEEEEIRRQLKRLEEEQKEMVADLDELNERMEEEQNRSRTAEAREQLNEAREEAQEAAGNLEKEQLDEATNAGTRAAEKFQELAEDFRERTSNQFAEEVREARREARDLAEAEREIAGKMARQTRETPNEDTISEIKRKAENAKLSAELAEQGKELEALLERLRELSEQAEEGEPMLVLRKT